MEGSRVYDDTGSFNPMYLCIETRFLLGSVRLDFPDGIAHRMSPSPEAIHWSRPYAETGRTAALLF